MAEFKIEDYTDTYNPEVIEIDPDQFLDACHWRDKDRVKDLIKDEFDLIDESEINTDAPDEYWNCIETSNRNRLKSIVLDYFNIPEPNGSDSIRSYEHGLFIENLYKLTTKWHGLSKEDEEIINKIANKY